MGVVLLLSPCPQCRPRIQLNLDGIRSVVATTQAHVLAGVLSRRCHRLHAGPASIGAQVPEQVADVAFETTGARALVSIHASIARDSF